MTIVFNIRTEHAKEPKLSGAILLYGVDGKNAFATVHQVQVSANRRPVILAGKPLTLRASRTILSSLSKNAVGGGGYLPECVLMANGDEMMWYEPPQVRHLGFKVLREASEQKLGTLAGPAPTPGVIFHVSGNDWRVFAYTAEGRPTPETLLFHAPTFNTYEDGRICVGSARTPTTNTADSIRAWSEAFWQSNFTHPNYDGVVNYRGDAPALWRDAMAGKFGDRFPTRVLKPYRSKVGEYIERSRRQQ